VKVAPFAVPILEASRLRLRGFREDDFETVDRWCGDAETMRHIGEGQPMSRGDAWRGLAMIVGHWPLRGYAASVRVAEKIGERYEGQRGVLGRLAKVYAIEAPARLRSGS